MAQGAHPITVDQLIALNDEIRALSRAGVPLDKGLRALGSDLPGRLGRLADDLGRRLERGEGLLEVLQSQDEAFPPVYLAVIAAGLRAGRLPAALESIAHSVRQTAELRRSLMIALVYPLALSAIATAVFVFSTQKTVPIVQRIYELLDVARPAWYQSLTSVAAAVVSLLPWIWAVMIAGLVLLWFHSRRAVRLGVSQRAWLPTVGAVRAAGRLATFSEMLAMMVEQQVPLAESLPLAAAAGGGRELTAAGEALGKALGQGEKLVRPLRGIPPLLMWLIMTSANQAYLVRALRHQAAYHRRRAIRFSLLVGTYLPIFLSAFVGGAVGLYYVLLNMAPFYYLLYQLGQA